jgi:hypothetical protein
VIATLAFRHLWVRRIRSLFLLLGFALGVGVMIVLLSIGEAMLDQSRDVALVGGGEVTVLPQGIDVEAMRTGGLSGMFFSIERARFLTRQVLGGPRHAAMVRTVAPAIEGKLLYLCPVLAECRPTAVRVGAEIPSRAAAVGTGLDVLEGRWADTRADSAYVSPTQQQLYDELDRFHVPRRPDPSWGEWHYFNLVTDADEWWYVSYLLGGELPEGKWGGRMLVTHRRRDGKYDRYMADAPSDQVAFDTTRADLSIGESHVRQRNGVYHLRARAHGRVKAVLLELAVHPLPNQYFPPVELREEELLSGYVVPGLAATAEGRICIDGRCRQVANVPAYHDHNWGVWRDVTWEWGAAHGSRLGLLYGGIYGPRGATSPFFLTLVDSAGIRQVLRSGRLDYAAAGASPPSRFSLTATRDADTIHLDVSVRDTLATDMSAAAFRRTFLQMRGSFRLRGTLSGAVVSDGGEGFFETYLPR